MDDVVFIAHSMENDGYAYTDALKMLRKKKFSDDYEPHPWVTGMKAITFEMSVKEKKTSQQNWNPTKTPISCYSECFPFTLLGQSSVTVW